MCNLPEPYLIELDKIIREGVTEFCKENNISADITLEYCIYKPLFLGYEITYLIPGLKKKYSVLITVRRDEDNIILLKDDIIPLKKKIPADCKKIAEMKDDIKNYIKEVLKLLKKILENEPALNELIENIKKLVKAEGLDCELFDLPRTAKVRISLCEDSIAVIISKADVSISSIAVSFKDKYKSEIMVELLKNFHHIHEPMEVDEYRVEIDVKNVSRDRQLEILSKTIDALIAFHLI